MSSARRDNNLDRRSFVGGGAAVAASLLIGSKANRAWAVDAGSSSDSPIAETTSGKVRGRLQGGVNSFRGIPYGASTEGAARFLPPSKAHPWSGVRDALEVGTRAPQIQVNRLVPEWFVMEYAGPIGEDCLSLNVWTQGLKDGGKRPVMFWLHGGAYSNGSSGGIIYDGTNLAAKHDVVIVGVNHRLNIFGFLYLAELGDERFANASNVGMLDIVLGLEWVRDNIANFGGDPNNVTIFGQSGGAGKVSMLLGMPPAKGLFHRAIVESGSAVDAVSSEQATKSARGVLEKLALKTNQIAELQKIPMDQLLRLSVADGGVKGLSPVVDGHTLPAVPFNPVATNISAEVPLIIGSNETEVTWNANMNYDPLDDAALRARLKETVRVDDAAADQLIAAYRKSWPKASNLDLFLILATDFSNFRTGTDTEAELKAVLGKAPVYKYYFRWYSPVAGGKLRAMHTMELPFVFRNLEIAKTEIGEATPELHALSDKMSAAWVAFARTGNPNQKGLANWPAFDVNRRGTMIFNVGDCQAVNDPYREQRLARMAIKTQA